MRKKIIIYSSRRNGLDHFSLKKLVKKVGNVATDVVKLGAQPIAKSITSITGKEIPKLNTFSTKIGKVAGKIQGTASNALHSTAKGFADTVTGGLATKAANVLRKEPYKEKAFSYNEMKNTGQTTGIKLLDKTAAILPKVGAVAGGTYGGVVIANKIKEAVSPLPQQQQAGNMKANDLIIGENVLTGQPSPMTSPALTASMGEIKPLYIFLGLGALVLLGLFVGGNKTE